MNEIVVDTREKIKILNEYFAEVCTWTGSIIDSKIADCLSESKVLINKFTVVQPEAENILRSLDHSRAYAPEITNRMIKNMAQSIVKPVCKLIYESFETSIFPGIWKNGVINPLYKSGDSLKRSNYRPITLLKVLSKV
ncbi:unnamed protein product [Didymodactylos carnosus]|uniref:Uncharacterized protein n=1 Tax=Didymodactylos carnosus TaxID=1234261 RepID=A0A8S2UQ31_9BILA|nr:unnamed protein product [Didymodactylos carnosus]